MMLSRYCWSATFGSQPICERWLMMPILPDPFGDSQKMQKYATSCVAT